MLHVLEGPRNDHAVVVAAVARPDADQLVGLGVDEGDAAGEPLEAAEHADHVFAVIGDPKVCMSGPMPWISFLIVQVLVSTTMMPLNAGEGCRIVR